MSIQYPPKPLLRGFCYFISVKCLLQGGTYQFEPVPISQINKISDQFQINNNVTSKIDESNQDRFKLAASSHKTPKATVGISLAQGPCISAGNNTEKKAVKLLIPSSAKHQSPSTDRKRVGQGVAPYRDPSDPRYVKDSRGFKDVARSQSISTEKPSRSVAVVNTIQYDTTEVK